MKFTRAWLGDHLESDADVATIGDTLTMIGLELEEVRDPARDLAPFTVALVTACEPHPDADRLLVCRVDTGAGEVQVVCGAPNARAGMKGVFAPAGIRIPGTGLDLKRGVIRGVESNGMLCSEREMGLSDEHEGIIELPEDAKVGAPFAGAIGLDDPVFDIAITPNRQDCLGVHGVARDLAAAGLGRLKPFDAAAHEGAFESPIAWRRDFPEDEGHACPMVVGRAFRGLRNGPSPRWMQDRLRAIGLRPISALVDITNFVTHDLGRPLHVFDADKLAGDLTMRFAAEGEEVAALDGRTYALDPAMVVIADNAAVHGIGGIMGGEASGCTEATTTAFLEAALFDPVRVAATGRALQIESDARYRFERGVDPRSALWGAEVATRLILELCGGEASALTVAGEVPEWQRTVALRPERVRSLGGVDVPAKECGRILEALGFGVSARNGVLDAAVPSWRVDLEGEADLVEEITRIHGYDRIPAVAMTLDTALPPPAIDVAQRRVRDVKRGLATRGLLEAVTWSFTSSEAAALFGGAPESVRLANPIASELDVMRPSILPNLIAAAGRNADRGFADVGLYEVGPQYADDTPEGQATVAAGLRAGRSGTRHWAGPPREVDAFDAKADALSAIADAGGPADKVQLAAEAPPWYHPGRSGTVRLGPNVLAAFGEIHPRVLARMGVKGPVVGFELFLDAIPLPRRGRGKGRPLLRASPFQAVGRDFAFVVEAGVPAEAVVRAARGAGKALIEDVRVFDVYTGPGLEEGEKSIAIHVRLQPTEKTLTEEEIEAVAAKVVAGVAKQTGGRLRA